MAMTAIDRAALIEAAAKAIHDVQNVDWRNWGNTNQAPYLKQAKAALPMIARELLAPLRELHADHECGNYDQASWCHAPYGDGRCVKVGTCSHCGHKAPCPTVRLLDLIEADTNGGE